MTTKEKLSETMIIPNDDILKTFFKEKVDEIVHNQQTHGRSMGQLYNNVKGHVLEFAWAQLIDGEINTQEFDYTNPETYMYDVSKNGKLYEIKNTLPDSTWFNFNVRGECHSHKSLYNSVDLKTFFNHNHKLDALITGSYEESDTEFAVKFKMIIDAKTFQNYTQESQGINRGTTHYYHHRRAVADGNCVLLNY